MAVSVEVLGTILGGKYRPVRLLARGGMGAVYEGEHVEIGHKVAIKVMKPELADRAEAIARFRREAQIAGSLGHDNICSVLDLGTTPDGAPYLVMPLLRGVSLARVLGESGVLPEARALDIAAQVLAALSAAHQVGVVHRDLKPDNVFLTQVGDRTDFVKVLDFGISKVIGAHREASRLTQTGTLVGTPYYMAPEQARGLKDQDARVDVYAVGVMLYEMLTGVLPFMGDEIGDVIVKIATEGFKSPRILRPDLSPAVEALVLRAMERERDSRFADATTMRAAILAALDGTAHVPVATPFPVARTTPATPAPVALTPPERSAHVAMQTDLRQTTPFGWNASGVSPGPRKTGRAWLVGFALALALAGGLFAIVAVSGHDDGARTTVPMPAAATLPLATPPAPTSELPAPPPPSDAAVAPVATPTPTPASSAPARAPAKIVRTPRAPRAGETPGPGPLEGPGGTRFATENE